MPVFIIQFTLINRSLKWVYSAVINNYVKIIPHIANIWEEMGNARDGIEYKRNAADQCFLSIFKTKSFSDTWSAFVLAGRMCGRKEYSV